MAMRTWTTKNFWIGSLGRKMNGHRSRKPWCQHQMKMLVRQRLLDWFLSGEMGVQTLSLQTVPEEILYLVANWHSNSLYFTALLWKSLIWLRFCQQFHRTQDEIPKVEVSGFSEMAADARERLLKSSSGGVGDMTLQEASQIKELNDIAPRQFFR